MINRSSTTSVPPYRIGLLLIDGFAAMSYASTTEPLRAANLLAKKTLYVVRHIPVAGARARSSGKAELRADEQLGEQVNYDLVLVIAGENPTDFDDRRVFQWLRHLAHRGVMLGGISSGPMILAAAGVMQGRRMTLHWEHARIFNEIYPSLMIEKTLFVIDRDRMTCAGGTAPLDMMHALITRQHGADFARKVSDWFMHTEVREASHPQRSGLAERYQIHNPVILTTIEIMRNNLAEPLALSELARLNGISVRQLNRLFHDHLHSSPMNFYRNLRLVKAHELLKKSALTVMDIALAAGYSQATHFSRAITAQFGKSPSQLRKSED